MKREDIEFRVWSLPGKFFFPWGPKDYFTVHGVSPECLLFQQYTGVKDVQDQKIFEGDFVVLEYGQLPESVIKKNIFEIVFERGVFALQPRKLDKPDGCLGFSWIKYIVGHKKSGSPIYKYELPGPLPLSQFNICRVIGNKQEHPKLVK